MTEVKNIWVVYDFECPLCHMYCQAIRIRKDIGEFHLIDARKPSKIMDEITALGLDIDNGMVVKVGDTIYYGGDAIHILTLLSTRSGFLNRINYWIFGSKFLAKVLYPLFRNIRNFLLFTVMRKSKINNVK